MPLERPPQTGPDLANARSRVGANLERVHSAIRAAAERAGRDPATVQLVAVSKTVPVEEIRVALAAGQRTFGENRVQEALPKIAALAASAARWHMVGRLQTNKAKFAGRFDMLESVDSLRLAHALDRHLERPLPVLLEVNVAGEAAKAGFDPQAAPAALTALRALSHLEVEGLMTVAPLVDDPEALRPLFRRLRELRDRLGLVELSMGMSNDFAVAVEEGATIVRIGRAIFGAR